MQKNFILLIGYKIEYLRLFPIVKLIANYAEIGRVGKLEANSQQVFLP